MESKFPNMTRDLFAMMGSSSAHDFDESLKWLYDRWRIFDRYDDFFDHEVAVFFRFDTKQLRDVKSCQLQVGVVNNIEYDVLRPELIKHDRYYQRRDKGLTTLRSGNWSWDPSVYGNAETGTYRRKISRDNMIIVQSKLNRTYLATFKTSHTLGEGSLNETLDDGTPTGRVISIPGVNVTRRLNNQGITSDLDFTNWKVFASYVNNFQYAADTVICDGKKGDFFDSSYRMAYPPSKTDTTLKLKEGRSFYLVVVCGILFHTSTTHTTMSS